MSQREPVVITNRSGHQLFGILHQPDRPPATDVAVILLSPGVKMRVGPECLYRRMTDVMVELGIPVLRFDFFGLGDSEGVIEEEFLKDVYNHIEVGRFVDDTLDAMNWMEERYGTKRFVLSGLCGGAITGLLTGSRDSRVAGLLALGITPLLASRAADPSLYMSSGQLTHLRRGYIRNLMNPSSWMRLLTMKSDYRALWRSLVQPLKKKLAARKVPAASAEGAAAPAAVPEHDNASPLFPPAFFKMLATQRPMLLIFGGSDRLRWDFEEKFLQRHPEKLAALPRTYQLHVIEHANHVLSFEAWQQEMLAVSRAWLADHFAAPGRPAHRPAVGAGA